MRIALFFAVMFFASSFVHAGNVIAAEARDLESAAVAPQACIPVYPDVQVCFVELYEVESFPSFPHAQLFLAQLTQQQRKSAALLTTNDQTRRALVVYRRLVGQPRGDRSGDRFVADLFVTFDQARARYDQLTSDQRAGAFLLSPREDLHGGLLIYRTFARGGDQ